MIVYTAVSKTFSDFPTFLAKKVLVSDYDSNVQIIEFEYVSSLPLDMTYWEE